ncbi:tRNA pseudouridine synthase-like 1 isoform X2 [Ahaetulla prasina]|uniref:tRNA pseudouridine synthase-like 1 isoform X2 n=1 Tax=Ahaetulla prasina TaxID=499056 RepID=UPI00264A4716|nr:tRNA pseudouridine synthase-like 1 isoform X2 [Ahaetulla prasina]XP_058016872.1 tRNA pseudouridine synthase-like 1 isoform X2 [Ahaetulla prasina]
MNSAKTRYLIFFQYFGAKYSGVMALPPSVPAVGVENHLEKAAENLRASEPVKFVVSSRTDAGVHALCNSAHLDIQRKEGQPPFSEDLLVQVLNKHLGSEPIRVLSACRVSSNFHARFLARARTYVYRVATGCTASSDLPVFERDLCWANWRGHLNLAAMQEAATFLMGTHNFSTFCSASSETSARNPIKTLNLVEQPEVLGIGVCKPIFPLQTGAADGRGIGSRGSVPVTTAPHPRTPSGPGLDGLSAKHHGAPGRTLPQACGILQK